MSSVSAPIDFNGAWQRVSMVTDFGNKENDPREREADLTADRDRVPVKKVLKVPPLIIIEAAPITKSSDPFLDVTGSYDPTSNGYAPLGKRKGGSQEEESAKRLRVENGRILNSNSAPTSDVVVSSCELSVWNYTAAASKGRDKRINDTTFSSSSSTTASSTTYSTTSTTSSSSTSTTSSSSSSSSSTSTTSLSVCDGHTNAVSQLIAGDFDGLFSPTVPIQNQNNPAITSSVHTTVVSMATTICAPFKSHTSLDTSGKIDVTMATHVTKATDVTTATEASPDTTSECPLPGKGEWPLNEMGTEQNGTKMVSSQSRVSVSQQNEEEEEGRMREEEEEERMEWKGEGEVEVEEEEEEEGVMRAMAESLREQVRD